MIREEPVGRWLRRHVERCPEGIVVFLQVGLVAADGLDEEVLANAYLNILMGCSEDGSVVTWGDVPKVVTGYCKLVPSSWCPGLDALSRGERS